MSNVIRSLVVKVGTDLTDMQKGFAQASKDLKKIGKDFSNTGVTLTKGLTLPIAGATAGIAALMGKSAESADELQKMSDVTGLSAERLQELKYAGSNLGVELETITGAQAKLTKSMAAAEKGTGSQAEAFKTLGISVTDSSGQLKDSKQIMIEAFNALNSVGNSTERDALSMQLFGKSAMELNPLIKAGGEELARLTDEAHKNGAVISNEGIASLDSFGDSIDAMKLSLSGAIGKVAAELVPTFQKLTPVLQDKIIPAIGDFAKKIGDLIVKFTELSPGMQSFILGLTTIALVIGPLFSVIGNITMALSTFSKAISLMLGVLTNGGGIGAALTALMGPAGVVLLIIAALATAAFILIKYWDPISAFFTNLWNSITSGISAAWAGISNFFTTTIPQIISNIIGFFANLPYEIGYAIGFVIGTLALWAINITSWIITNVPLIIDNIVSFFKNLPGNIANAIVGAAAVLKTWATNLITTAKAEIPIVISNIVDFFKELPSKMIDIGVNMVKGLWEGIKSMGNWIKDQFKGFIDGVIAGVKKGLGIASPSISVPTPTISGYASGTNFASPGLHWVGENGPELMSFRGGEKVIPSNESSRLAGGNTINNTINIYADKELARVYDLFNSLGQTARQGGY